jgi:hypothetical protein
MIPTFKKKGGTLRKFQTKDEVESSLVSAQVVNLSKFGGEIVKGYVRATPPRTFAEGRVCQGELCDKRLSIYNKGPFCYQHSAVKMPRVRGNNKSEKPMPVEPMRFVDLSKEDSHARSQVR